MVGKILKIEKRAGENVDEDEVVIVMEAMKMEIMIVAPVSGTLKEIMVMAGQAVEAEQVLAVGEEPHPANQQFRVNQMDAWTFGWTVALIGMGGTMLVLWILSLLILLLKKLFPHNAQPAGRG